MIKPTVGRKVWYRPSRSDVSGSFPMNIAGSLDAGNAQPLDATVIAVWSDRMVNLLVTDAVGRQFPVLSCTLLQGDDEPLKDADGKPIGRYAEWMPYQHGQAKAAVGAPVVAQ